MNMIRAALLALLLSCGIVSSQSGTGRGTDSGADILGTSESVDPVATPDGTVIPFTFTPAVAATDSNHNGENNLLEFANGQNPHATTRMSPTLTRNGANLEFTYNRSKAAVLDGVAFTVESSDTLGVSKSTAQQTDTLEPRLASVPRGFADSRFVHLRQTP